MIKYILLGVVQGATEFFPVSSSAHLVILQKIMHLGGEELALSVVLHLGTALALIVFFFKDIVEAARSFRMVSLIIIVTFITGVIGLLGKDFFESLFSSVKFAAAALLVTGAILLATKRMAGRARRDVLDAKDAVVLGFAQAIAIIPGISRSGITISSLIFSSVEPRTCFKFSFLAAIPVILGAALLEIKEINSSLAVSSGNFAAGFIASFAGGLLALWILKSVVARMKLHYFGYYCITVSIITLIFVR